ncbi:MAG: hypothetical protein JSS43_19250 [Proteobacteria bacterium]|nr:hypothetical protein [Pseudomonadota bacterium]
MADNACVRREMAAHEAAHNAAFNSTIDRFLDDNGPALRAGMIALKKTPAPSFDAAASTWEKGLQLIIEKAQATLLTELSTANAEVDSQPTLSALEAACDGILRKFGEQRPD